MKRRGFFKSVLALIGLKAVGADKTLSPNPDWVDAVPEVQMLSYNINHQRWIITHANGCKSKTWSAVDAMGDWEWIEMPITEAELGAPCDPESRKK